MPNRDTTENLSISFPSRTIEAMEKFCFNNDISRSHLVTKAVRVYLLTQLDTPEVWNLLYQKIFHQ